MVRHGIYKQMYTCFSFKKNFNLQENKLCNTQTHKKKNVFKKKKINKIRLRIVRSALTRVSYV